MCHHLTVSMSKSQASALETENMYLSTSLLLKGQTAWIGTKFKVNLQHIVQSYFHQSNWSQDLSCYPNLYMFDL